MFLFCWRYRKLYVCWTTGGLNKQKRVWALCKALVACGQVNKYFDLSIPHVGFTFNTGNWITL